MPKSIQISKSTIIFTVLFLLSLKFIAQVWDIILMVFIAIILMSAIAPLVDRLERYRLPRALSIIIIYVVLWGIVGTLLASIIPGIIDQTTSLIRLLPQTTQNIAFLSDHQQEINQQLINLISSLPQNLLKFTVNLFGNILNFFTTIVIAFYLLLERKSFHLHLGILTGHSDISKATKLIAELEKNLGSWVRGELILMFSVGLLTYIGLIILGVDIALPLAVLAGLLEIVPNIGPILSSIPSILVALSIHPLLALSTAALYFLVQFVENHLLVPNIMRKAVGVNPILSIIGLMIGFRLAGPVGAILAIPIIIVVRSVVTELSLFPGLKSLTSKV